MREAELQHDIRLIMGRHPTVRLFRNNVGAANFVDAHGNRQFVRYGLCEGSSDLIGFRTLDLPTGPLAQFVALELKTPGHRTDPRRLAKQRMFIEAVRSRGGLAGFCQTVEEAIELFETPLL